MSRSEQGLIIALILLLALILFSSFASTIFLIVAALFLGAIFFSFLNDCYRLFILGLLFPFQGLRFIIPPVRGSFFTTFFPDGVDLSLVNVLALLYLFIAGAQLVFSLWRGKKVSLRWPPLLAAALFWLSGFISVANAEEGTLLSVKYVFYPIIFGYLAFVGLPALWVRNRENLKALAAGMLGSGVLAALIGLLSLFASSVGEFRRAAPISIFGVWPLGMNHNLLAETLVATAPIALAFAVFNPQRRRFFLALAAFLAAISLLTFARTAWIAFLVMTAAAVFLEFRGEARRAWRSIAVAAVLILPLAFYLFSLSATREVGGSTASRLAMTEFALHLWREHPWIGEGAGTFVPRLGQAKDFTSEFGDPLDAHGFGQKILAEQGIVGLAAFLLLLGVILRALWSAVRGLRAGSPERRVLLFLSLAALGMMSYEVFNTTYYSAKLWLPIGLALAAIKIVRSRQNVEHST